MANANDENQDSQNTGSDNTDETNEDLLGDIPDEDEDEEDKDKGDKGKPEKPENRRSEIIQKQKYRDKYLKAKAELEALRNNPGTSKVDRETPPADEKERQALEFIRKQAREEYKALREEEKAQEAKALRDFEDEVDEILEDNEEITESELLDIVEEYEVSPKVAASILKKFKTGGGTTSKQKPKMPVSKRGTGSAPKTQPNDSKKSMYQVAQDIIRDLRNKGKTE